MMNFASNSALGKSLKFVDLGLLPSKTVDKLYSVFVPATRAEGLIDSSNWRVSRHVIEEVSVLIVSEAKLYSDYIKNYEFEIMNVFERENNSGI